MKTTIKTIEKAICNHYKNVVIKKYYVEDENEICQKIVVYGMTKDSYFAGSIIGAKKTEAEIMKDIEMISDRYEALYTFRMYL